MEYTALEGTDLTPSRIGLGTWAIGGWMWGGADRKEALNALILGSIGALLVKSHGLLFFFDGEIDNGID